jgi:hypothetical protein
METDNEIEKDFIDKYERFCVKYRIKMEEFRA